MVYNDPDDALTVTITAGDAEGSGAVTSATDDRVQTLLEGGPDTGAVGTTGLAFMQFRFNQDVTAGTQLRFGLRPAPLTTGAITADGTIETGKLSQLDIFGGLRGNDGSVTRRDNTLTSEGTLVLPALTASTDYTVFIRNREDNIVSEVVDYGSGNVGTFLQLEFLPLNGITIDTASTVRPTLSVLATDNEPVAELAVLALHEYSASGRLLKSNSSPSSLSGERSGDARIANSGDAGVYERNDGSRFRITEGSYIGASVGLRESKVFERPFSVSAFALPYSFRLAPSIADYFNAQFFFNELYYASANDGDGGLIEARDILNRDGETSTVIVESLISHADKDDDYDVDDIPELQTFIKDGTHIFPPTGTRESPANARVPTGANRLLIGTAGGVKTLDNRAIDERQCRVGFYSSAALNADPFSNLFDGGSYDSNLQLNDIFNTGNISPGSARIGNASANETIIPFAICDNDTGVIAPSDGSGTAAQATKEGQAYKVRIDFTDADTHAGEDIPLRILIGGRNGEVNALDFGTTETQIASAFSATYTNYTDFGTPGGRYTRELYYAPADESPFSGTYTTTRGATAVDSEGDGSGVVTPTLTVKRADRNGNLNPNGNAVLVTAVLPGTDYVADHDIGVFTDHAQLYRFKNDDFILSATPIADADLSEGVELFAARVLAPTGANRPERVKDGSIRFSGQAYTANVSEGGDPVSLQVSSASTYGEQGNRKKLNGLTFTLRRNNADFSAGLGGALHVFFSVGPTDSEQSANAEDFTSGVLSPSFNGTKYSVTIGASAASATYAGGPNIIVDDNVLEGNETFAVRVLCVLRGGSATYNRCIGANNENQFGRLVARDTRTSGAGAPLATLGNQDTYGFTLVDNDIKSGNARPAINLATTFPSGFRVDNNDGTDDAEEIVSLAVTLGAAPGNPVTFTIANQNGADGLICITCSVAGQPRSLRFNAGQRTITQTYRFNPSGGSGILALRLRLQTKGGDATTPAGLGLAENYKVGTQTGQGGVRVADQKLRLLGQKADRTYEDSDETTTYPAVEGATKKIRVAAAYPDSLKKIDFTLTAPINGAGQAARANFASTLPSGWSSSGNTLTYQGSIPTSNTNGYVDATIPYLDDDKFEIGAAKESLFTVTVRNNSVLNRLGQYAASSAIDGDHNTVKYGLADDDLVATGLRLRLYQGADSETTKVPVTFLPKGRALMVHGEIDFCVWSAGACTSASREAFSNVTVELRSATSGGSPSLAFTPDWPDSVEFTGKGAISTRSITYTGTATSYSLIPGVASTPFGSRRETFSAGIGTPSPVKFFAATSELPGGSGGAIAFSRTGRAGALSVPVTVTAADRNKLTGNPTTVTARFNDGSTLGTLIVTPKSARAGQTVRFTIAAADSFSGYSLGSPSTHTLTIGPTLGFSAAVETLEVGSALSAVIERSTTGSSPGVSLAVAGGGSSSGGAACTATNLGLNAAPRFSGSATTAGIAATSGVTKAALSGKTCVITISPKTANDGSGYAVNSAKNTLTVTVAAAGSLPTAEFTAVGAQRAATGRATWPISVEIANRGGKTVKVLFEVGGDAGCSPTNIDLPGIFVAVPGKPQQRTVNFAWNRLNANGAPSPGSPRTCTVTILPGSGYKVGTNNVLTVAFLKSSPPEGSFSKTSATIAAGESLALPTISFAQNVGGDGLQVPLHITGDSASCDRDLFKLARSAGIIGQFSGLSPAATIANPQTVPAGVLNDPGECVIHMGFNSNYRVSTTAGTFTVTIGDPKVSFSATSEATAPGATMGTLVQTTAPTRAQRAIKVAVSGDGCTPTSLGLGGVGVGGQTLQRAFNLSRDSSANLATSGTTLGDGASCTLTLQPGTGYVLGTDKELAVSVSQPPTVRFTQGWSDATAHADDSDYDRLNGNIQVLPSASAVAQNVVVTVGGDSGCTPAYLQLAGSPVDGQSQKRSFDLSTAASRAIWNGTAPAKRGSRLSCTLTIDDGVYEKGFPSVMALTIHPADDDYPDHSVTWSDSNSSSTVRVGGRVRLLAYFFDGSGGNFLIPLHVTGRGSTADPNCTNAKLGIPANFRVRGQSSVPTSNVTAPAGSVCEVWFGAGPVHIVQYPPSGDFDGVDRHYTITVQP